MVCFATARCNSERIERSPKYHVNNVNGFILDATQKELKVRGSASAE